MGKPGIIDLFSKIGKAKVGDSIEVELELDRVSIDSVKSVLNVHGFKIEKINVDTEHNMVKIKARKDRDPFYEKLER